MAPGRAYDAGNAPRALAPPAISKASAAGTGNPIASRNTAANRITNPCAARFEIQESMTMCFVIEARAVEDAKGHANERVPQGNIPSPAEPQRVTRPLDQRHVRVAFDFVEDQFRAIGGD